MIDFDTKINFPPKLLTVVFFLSIFIIFLLPHFDSDFGWHYRCGAQIIQKYTICRGGEFNYFLPNYKWANPNFLYDILIYLVFNCLGFWGLTILGSLILTILVGILYFKNNITPIIKIPFVYLLTFLSWDIFKLGFRSQILSLFIAIITISFILKVDKNKTFKQLFWFPPLFLVWSNTHGGFFLGPLIFGLFVLSKIIETIKNQENLKNLKIILVIFLICVLSTLINPFGFHIYEEVYRHFQTPLNNLIAEWVPPVAIDAYLTISCYLIFIGLSLFFKKLKSFEFLIITLFLLFALMARRNLPLFYFSFGFLLLNIFPSQWKHKTEFALSIFLTVLICVALIFYAPKKFNALTLINNDFNNYCQNSYVRYPKTAVEFIKKNIPARLNKNVFNTYEWGGFLIWQLPEMNFFVDGRMPAWQGETNKSPYTTWLEIIQTKNDWDKKLELYQTDYLLISPGTFLDLLLKDMPQKFNYQELYRDEMAVIYKRNEK